MDRIQEIGNLLTPQEQEDFIQGLHRNQAKHPGKIIQLFQHIVQHQLTDRTLLLAHLYPEKENVDAYLATRKRLLNELTIFLSQLQRKKYGSKFQETETNFSAANYLFAHHANKLAWEYLREAERLASQMEALPLLNAIYSYQIEKSDTEFAPPILEIVKKKEKCLQLNQAHDKAYLGLQLLRKKIQEALQDGKALALEKELREVWEKLQMSENILEHPRILLQYIAMIRNFYLLRKDFQQLLPFIKKYYQLLTDQGFESNQLDVKIQLHYYTAHALYRAHHFEASLQVLASMKSCMEEQSGRYSGQYYTTYNLLLANNLNFTGQAQKAIQLLQEVQHLSASKSGKKNYYNSLLTLSLLYLQQEQIHSAVLVFRSIHHSDEWLRGQLGKEWLIKKTLLDIILQCELGNTEIALTRIKNSRKKFKEFFLQEFYQRIEIFLRLVEAYCKNPIIATQKEFSDSMELAFTFIETEKEDLQAITYYAWLKAKVKKEKYYSCLLKILKA
jgi:hypothetical protein